MFLFQLNNFQVKQTVSYWKRWKKEQNDYGMRILYGWTKILVLFCLPACQFAYNLWCGCALFCKNCKKMTRIIAIALVFIASKEKMRGTKLRKRQHLQLTCKISMNNVKYNIYYTVLFFFSNRVQQTWWMMKWRTLVDWNMLS